MNKIIGILLICFGYVWASASESTTTSSANLPRHYTPTKKSRLSEDILRILREFRADKPSPRMAALEESNLDYEAFMDLLEGRKIEMINIMGPLLISNSYSYQIYRDKAASEFWIVKYGGYLGTWELFSYSPKKKK